VIPDLDSWFEQEVLLHERSLVRYLTRVWPNTSEIQDIVQEVYVRTYEAARTTRPTAVKSFLFTTARHLLTDKARRNRVVSIEAVGDSEVLNVTTDELTPERRLNARQEVKLLAMAFSRLSERCREVVWLRRIDAVPQKEVARRMGLSERTVETYLARGMQHIADTLYAGTTVMHADADREPIEAKRTEREK
jgi:RNA polymerase sigma-70 factor (ECF subfamily)